MKLWLALATGLGLGRLPLAPGSWASLAALAPAAALVWAFGPWGLALAAAAVWLAGCRAAERYQQATGRHDPGEVVIDEIAAQWLVLAFLPPEPLAWLLGFAAFRLFDIAKPPPIRWLERRLAGGVGVMADDLAAAAYAVMLLALADWGLGYGVLFG